MKTNFIFLKGSLTVMLLAFICFPTAIRSQVQYSGTINSGEVATAINFETQATGNWSFAAGYQSIASGHTSFAIGYQNLAEEGRSFAIGEFCQARTQCYAFGRNVKLLGVQSFGFGLYVEGHSNNTFTFGFNEPNYPLVNNIAYSFMFGNNSTRPTLFISDSEHAINHDGLGMVGIGTTTPVARLQVAEGDIFIEDINSGIVMKSPDGNCWRGTLTNEGTLDFQLLDDCETLTKISEYQTQPESNFKIFPNPTESFVDISCLQSDLSKYTSLSLVDMKGNIIFSTPFSSATTRLSLNQIDPGTYLIKIFGDQSCYTEIIIVK